MGNGLFSILGTSVQPKDPAGRRHPLEFSFWVDSFETPSTSRASPIHLQKVKFIPASDTHRCSFDAKVNGQDVRIRTSVRFSLAREGLLTGVRGFVLIGSAMMTLSKLVNTLQRHYGSPTPPPATAHWS